MVRRMRFIHMCICVMLVVGVRYMGCECVIRIVVRVLMLLAASLLMILISVVVVLVLGIFCSPCALGDSAHRLLASALV